VNCQKGTRHQNAHSGRVCSEEDSGTRINAKRQFRRLSLLTDICEPALPLSLLNAVTCVIACAVGRVTPPVGSSGAADKSIETIYPCLTRNFIALSIGRIVS
jgi:hypothetical protein